MQPNFNLVGVDYEFTFLFCTLEIGIRYPPQNRFCLSTDFFVGKYSSLLEMAISRMEINEVDTETSCYYGSCNAFHWS